MRCLRPGAYQFAEGTEGLFEGDDERVRSREDYGLQLFPQRPQRAQRQFYAFRMEFKKYCR